MKLARILASLVLAVGLCIAPAAATFAPVVTVVTPTAQGAPGANRAVYGFITLGAADAYVTGGFTISPQAIGFNNGIATFVPFFAGQTLLVPAFQPSATVALGIATITLQQPVNGASNMTAAGTTKVVSLPTGVVIGINTPIVCVLDNTATGGGGAGTWATTNAVNTCQETSTTSFTLTTIAAAPASNGNFTWLLPTVFGEIASATSVASVVIPFVATGN